jgi:serine/threonine protein kinase
MINSEAILDDTGQFFHNKKATLIEDGGEKLGENLLGVKKISLNDFTFLKVIGRGSFGKVYLVYKKDQPDLPLAMKVLAKDVVFKRNLMIKT